MTKRLQLLLALGISLVGVSTLSGCSSSGSSTDAGTLGPDGGLLADGGLSQPTWSYAVSNAALSGHDLSFLTDVDISADCELDTGTGGNDGCFDENLGHAASWIAQQSNGSSVQIYAVRSLHLEQTAKMTLRGGLPAIIVAVNDINLAGTVDAAAHSTSSGPGGFAQGSLSLAGNGPAGGTRGTDGSGALGTEQGIAGGGGGFCGVGGTGAGEGGGAAPPVAPASKPAYGSADLRPLMGGSSGGSGGLGAAGAGGGAVQFSAGGTFTLGQFAIIQAGGSGGSNSGEVNAGQEASGGGAGGAVLIEAVNASLAGVIEANGGGGGGPDSNGQDSLPSTVPAQGGTASSVVIGGNGSAGGTVTGGAGVTAAARHAGGGGGGAGWIRINTHSGSATGGTFSPSPGGCMTQGTLRAAGSGI